MSAPGPYKLLGPYHPLLPQALVTLSIIIIPIMSIATRRIQTIMALVSMGATFIKIVRIAKSAIQTSNLGSAHRLNKLSQESAQCLHQAPYRLLGPYHSLLLQALVTLSVNTTPIMSIAMGRIQTIMALVSMGDTIIPLVSIARGAIQTSFLMSRNHHPLHLWH